MSLQVRSLTKAYPTRSGPLDILRGVDLELQGGESLAIMGASGSGKSTLLSILGTLDHPTTGTVTVDNRNPFQLRESELAAFRNEKIGFIFQDHHLLPQLSVLENVMVPTLVRAPQAGQDPEKYARELLDRVGLSHRLEHLPAELSGGERQRVAVARALIHRPSLILADEPTGNLDRHSAQEVSRLLIDLHQHEKNVLIVVTHSRDLAAMFPKQLEMGDGVLMTPAV